MEEDLNVELGSPRMLASTASSELRATSRLGTATVVGSFHIPNRVAVILMLILRLILLHVIEDAYVVFC